LINIRKKNNSYLSITGHLEDLYVLREWFGKEKKNWRFDKKRVEEGWDGKIRHFNMFEKTLPYGLIGELFDCIEAHDMACDIDDKLLKEIDSKKLTDFEEYAFMNVNPKYLKGGECEPRDYQDEGARLLLEDKRGILEHATRSGKSLTSFYAVNYIFNKFKEQILEKNIKIMVIVPTTHLILAFSKDFVEYGIDEKYVGRYYAKEKDNDTPIVVGTWQSLRSANHFHKNVVFAVGDECHGGKAYEVKQLLEKLINAKIRLGMTATLPSDENERFTIIGSFGPILSSVGARELINRGILAEPHIKFLMLNYPRGTDAEVKRKTDAIKKNEEAKFQYVIERLKEKLTPYYHSIEKLEESIENHCNFKTFSIGNGVFTETDKKITDKKVAKIRSEVRKFNEKTLRFILEKETVRDNTNRKKITRNIIKKHGDETMLFLFNEEKFGLDYLDYLREQYPDKIIHFVNYRVDVKEREKIIKDAVEKKGVILVASLKTFALGVTIPNLSVIGLLWGGKSEITVPQALGRGLMICGTKNTVTLYDYADQLFYTKKHANERLKIYMKESHKVQIHEMNL
jgi:superfamily II DNA or RNA helicase